MVTMVDGEFPEATVYFPGINPAEWKEVSRERFSKDERNEYSFDIVVFERAA
jgi:dihydrofolate reductase